MFCVAMLLRYISISDTRHLDCCNALLSRWRVLINLVIYVISTLKRTHSRAHPLQSRCTHVSSSEWQCSSVSVVLLHLSHWRAISIETPIIHIRPTGCSVLQPCYCQQTGLSSLRRQSLLVSLHILPQHRRSRFSGSVLRLFSSSALILTKLRHSLEFTCCCNFVIQATLCQLIQCIKSIYASTAVNVLTAGEEVCL